MLSYSSFSLVNNGDFETSLEPFAVYHTTTDEFLTDPSLFENVGILCFFSRLRFCDKLFFSIIHNRRQLFQSPQLSAHANRKRFGSALAVVDGKVLV